MRHWLADVQFGSFAPAFTLLKDDSERYRKTTNSNNLGRLGGIIEKRK